MKCCGMGEGCECSNCLDLRMEEQREYDYYQQQQQQEQHDEWARDQEAAYWGSEIQAAHERLETVRGWVLTESELDDRIAELKADMRRLADETRKANEAWHVARRELEWLEAVRGDVDVED